MQTQLLQFIKQTFLYIKALLDEPKLQNETSELNSEYIKNEFFVTKKAYFKSAEWRRKQRQAKARYNHKCCNCGTYQNLKVIHLSGYEQIPNEPVSCLTTLCSKCRTQLYTAHPKPQTLEQHYLWDAHNFKFNR